ncbi:hypothetical protein ACOMHN_020848 [Nucella lapillus]
MDSLDAPPTMEEEHSDRSGTVTGAQRQEWNSDRSTATGAQRQEHSNRSTATGAQQQEHSDRSGTVTGAQRQEWNSDRSTATGAQQQEHSDRSGTVTGAQQQEHSDRSTATGAQRQERPVVRAMPRMVSTQQANRRHEDKLRQLEDQLSAERIRVHNKLWEDTQRLQKDLIQLRIRTPNTTHTPRDDDCPPGRSGRPATQLESRAVGKRETDERKLVTKSKHAHLLNKESSETHTANDKRQAHLMFSGRTKATKCTSFEGERKKSDCVGNVLLSLPDRHEEENAHNQRDGRDMCSGSKSEGFGTISSLRGPASKGIPSMGRKENGSFSSQERQPLTSVTENQENSTLKETHKGTPNSIVFKEMVDSSQPKKINEVRADVESSGKETIVSKTNSLLHHTNAVSNLYLPTESENILHSTTDSGGETSLNMSDLLAVVPRRVNHVRQEEQSYHPHNLKPRQAKTLCNIDEAQQTALQIKREAVRKHQQNVLPTVEVHGDHVQYFYKGLPGQSKTFTPDSRTQTLLRRNSQIGSTLQDLYHKKNSYVYQFSPGKNPDQTADNKEARRDGESKQQFESLVHGWPQGATNRRKLLLMKKGRKAKMTSLLTMKSPLSVKSSSDLEDESLPGWRLLKLYKLWNNGRDRPAWATSSYLRRKHQENEHHQNCQQRHASTTDVETKVVEAMSAGTLRKKSHPKTGLKRETAAKTWFRKAKLANPKSSGPSPQKSSSKTRPFVYEVSSELKKETLPDVHQEQDVSHGKERAKESHGQKRAAGCKKWTRGGDWVCRGRKVVVGMEHRMWVGNLSLSTGLTGTVATSRRHPDIMVRKDH